MPPPRWVSTEGIVQWGLHEDCDWDRAPWEAAATASDNDDTGNGTTDAPVSPCRDSSGDYDQHSPTRQVCYTCTSKYILTAAVLHCE
jgi:hypothetical protein